MSDPKFTIKDIAERLAQSDDPAEIAYYLGRVKNWTNLGLLQLSGGTHIGTGRAREYPQKALYAAALVSELSNYGMSVGAMKDALTIFKTARVFARKETGRDPWQDAVEGRRPVYVLFHKLAKTDSGWCELDIKRLKLPDGWASSILLDLSQIFWRIRD